MDLKKAMEENPELYHWIKGGKICSKEGRLYYFYLRYVLSFYFDLSGEDIIDAEGRGYFVAAAFSICFSYSRN